MALSRVKNKLPGIDHNRTIELLTEAYRVCTSMKDQFTKIDIPQVASEAKDWVVERPYKTGIYIASGVIFTVPGLVKAPAHGLAGFTAEGVAADTSTTVRHRSAAAAAQSAVRSVAAGTSSATLQSAGAAGLGLAIVNGAVQGTMTAVQALNVGISAFWRKSQESGHAQGSGHVEVPEANEEI